MLHCTMFLILNRSFDFSASFPAKIKDLARPQAFPEDFLGNCSRCAANRCRMCQTHVNLTKIQATLLQAFEINQKHATFQDAQKIVYYDIPHLVRCLWQQCLVENRGRKLFSMTLTQALYCN